MIRHLRNKTENTRLLIVLSVLPTIFGIWTIVEFILYVFKDNPFNWTSLIVTIITLMSRIFFFIKTFH